MTIAVVVVSLALQLVAAGLAVRLVRISGRPRTWGLLAGAIALIAVRSAVTLAVGEPHLGAESIGLVMSVLMVGGIARARPLIQSIQRAEEEVGQLVESAPDAMVLADGTDRIALVNAAAVRLFGWSRHQMIGQDVTMLMPERFRERHRARRGQYHESPRPRLLGASQEVYALRKDGTEFPVEVSVSPLHTAQGAWVVSSVHDLSARKESERALRESEGKYRTLLDDVLDSSSVGVCILDKDRRVVWVNRAFEGHFGLARAEVVGFDARRLWGERLRFMFEDPKEAGERILATYDGTDAREVFEAHVVADDGREAAWLEIRSQPITAGLYKGGRIEHYADISERKQADLRIRLFADIARNMRTGLLVYRLDDEEDDRSLRIRAVNPEGARLLRVDPDRILNRAIDDAFPGLRAHDIPRLFADVVRKNEACDVEEFQYGDRRVLENIWSFRAFPLPDRCVGVVFESITSRKRAEELVQNIAAGLAGEQGKEYFDSLALGLARSLGLEFAMIGELEEPGRDTIRTLGMCSHGAIVDNLSYALSGTPCSEVVGHHVCCFTEGVAERFPEDTMLQEMEAECYVGTPLFDSSGDPLGLIAVLGRRRLEDPDTARAVLQIFAARAATEVERQRAKTIR